jgi:hypothetical protein
MASDLVRPFSSARAAAAWLERPEYAQAILVGSVDYAVEPIAAWTQRPLYYPDQKRFGTFMHWGSSRRIATMNQVLADSIALLRRESRPVLLILSRESRDTSGLVLGAEVSLGPNIPARYVARFVGAIVPYENYEVFALYPPRHSRPPARH